MSVAELLRIQSGVVSRRQLARFGLLDSDIRRMVRRRELARVHPGVFVDHTGEATWLQRAWAACLYYEPAALGPASTLTFHGVLQATVQRRVGVVVGGDRRVEPTAGVEVRRSVAYPRELHPLRTPPQLRLEPAALRVASQARDDASAIAVLADLCRSGRTTADRLCEALTLMPRMPRRAFLLGVLGDVAIGVQSVLEHHYLRDVERAHGLPQGVRQRRVSLDGKITYRDVEYLGRLLVVELDGAFHDATEQRWSDLERDVAGAVHGSRTIRLGWRQILEPCRTAQALAGLLTAWGWSGRPQLCPRCR